jgi:hypothetical protein
MATPLDVEGEFLLSVLVEGAVPPDGERRDGLLPRQGIGEDHGIHEGGLLDVEGHRFDQAAEGALDGGFDGDSRTSALGGDGVDDPGALLLEGPIAGVREGAEGVGGVFRHDVGDQLHLHHDLFARNRHVGVDLEPHGGGHEAALLGQGQLRGTPFEVAGQGRHLARGFALPAARDGEEQGTGDEQRGALRGMGNTGHHASRRKLAWKTAW